MLETHEHASRDQNAERSSSSPIDIGTPGRRSSEQRALPPGATACDSLQPRLETGLAPRCNCFEIIADDVLSGSPLASRQPSSFHSFSSVGGSGFGGRSASGAGDVAEEMRRLRVEDFEGPASPHPGLSVQVGMTAEVSRPCAADSCSDDHTCCRWSTGASRHCMR